MRSKSQRPRPPQRLRRTPGPGAWPEPGHEQAGGGVQFPGRRPRPSERSHGVSYSLRAPSGAKPKAARTAVVAAPRHPARRARAPPGPRPYPSPAPTAMAASLQPLGCPSRLATRSLTCVCASAPSVSALTKLTRGRMKMHELPSRKRNFLVSAKRTRRGGIMLKSRVWVSSFALLSALSALPALTQSARCIGGTVSNPSSSTVPGATITAINQTTSATKSVTSTANGSYTISLPPGVYSVAVTLKGFGKQTRKDLKVDGGATVTADFSLETKLEEEITVTAMKREESIQNTPFSVAAANEGTWRQRSIDGIGCLAA